MGKDGVSCSTAVHRPRRFELSVKLWNRNDETNQAEQKQGFEWHYHGLIEPDRPASRSILARLEYYETQYLGRAVIV